MSGKVVRRLSIRVTDTLVFHAKMSIRRFHHLYRFLKSPQRFVLRKSYFPEERLKSKRRVFLEQLSHILRHGEINEYYFTYGLDRVASRPREFLPFSHFMYRKDRKNFHAAGLDFNFLCLLKDKLSFGAFCRGAGVQVPTDIAAISGGDVQWLEDRTTIALQDMQHKEFDGFCKPRYGRMGKDTFPLKIEAGRIFKDGRPMVLQELQETLSGEEWVLQERITGQHERLRMLYPGAINTIRLTTVNSRGSIEVLGAGLRVGANGMRVDNWSAGGILIPLDVRTGRLRKYGFYKPGIGKKTERHPDTEVVFENFEVPMLKEAIGSARYLHGLMKGVHSIGWDICITGSGPLFVEGNDQWHSAIVELALGGARPAVERLFKS